MSLSTENKTPLRIFLLDDDPIFRLGIFTALEDEKYSNFQVLAQAEIAALSDLLAQEIPDLLLLSVDLVRYPERLNSTFVLCRQLNNKYPDLIIFLLTPLGANKAIQKIPGVKGCCPKNVKIDELVEGLITCQEKGTYFTQQKELVSQDKRVGGWVYNQCKSGLNKVEGDLSIILDYLQKNGNQLPPLDYMFWHGRKRELKAARWLIYQLLPTNFNAVIEEENLESPEDFENINNSNNDLEVTSSPSSLTVSNQTKLENIFDLTLAKIKGSVSNYTKNILEIDVLKNDKKKELLVIIVSQIRRVLEEFSIIDLEENQLSEKKRLILRDLWQSSTINFLSRYYQEEENSNNPYSLIETILAVSPIIEEENLSKISFAEEILAYWIFQKEIKIDDKVYAYNQKDSQEIEGILLENLILNIANIVVQFILNTFSDNESIRNNLYDLEWKSSRKIALFRNNLSWKYRQKKYWQRPKNIFEDKYEVLRLDYKGIVKNNIIHPRYQELSTLKGLPWFATIMIEFRDGIAKTLREIGDIIGKALVYILTDIVGKAIGLIGKGILQGIGKKIKS